MSYLDNHEIVLNRGCIDETGAQRYRKTANVPHNYVVDLQEDLQKLGFSPGSVDGNFGNRTSDALKDFQETARNTQRLQNGKIITVNPTYTKEAHGECDLETRQEIKLWLDLEYRAPWPVPPPWIGAEEPIQEHGIAFAPSTGKYWPIRTRERGGREVAYKGQSGRIYGSAGRRFLAPRSGGQRYHVGIDLWGEAGDLVVACEDGKIVNHYNFYDGVDCLIIQCDSGVVINYGEVKPNSWQLFELQNGSRVQAGQPIAIVGQMTNSSMCHFEVYKQGTTKSHRYCPGQQPPSCLLNPTKYLLNVAAKGKPLPSAQPILPLLAVSDLNLERVDFEQLSCFSGLEQYHRVFPGGVRWRLVPKGIEIEGSGIERTPGKPKTVTRIWDKYGDFINQWAEHYQVPCVIILATIATETSGNVEAIRKESGYQSDELTPHKISVGLMQTLISTARDTLDDNVVDLNWLLQPSNSIKAGTCYIAQQKRVTVYDPPKVACAYNSGNIYQNTGSSNRWKMRQYPIGTGEHCDRFVKWFNDAVAVLAEHDNKPSIPYEVYLN